MKGKETVAQAQNFFAMAMTEPVHRELLRQIKLDRLHDLEAIEDVYYVDDQRRIGVTDKMLIKAMRTLIRREKKDKKVQTHF